MTTRYRACTCVVTVSVALAAVTVSAQTRVKQIYPAPSKPLGNYAIAVLADGYAAGDEDQFDLDADNLITSDLMVDPFYANLGDRFTITTVFTPTPTGQASLFNIKIGGGIDNCYIQPDPATTDLLVDQAVAANVPLARRAVIIRNDGSMIGCTHDQLWTFVTSGTAAQVGTLEHEFGHLIGGLFDEYVLYRQAYQPPPPPPIFGPNCVTIRAVAWWDLLNLTPPPSKPPLPGCNYYATQIFRAYDTCRMADVSKEFCRVCATEITFWLDALAALPTLQPTGTPTASLWARLLPVVHAAQPPSPPPARGGRGTPGGPASPAVSNAQPLAPLPGAPLDRSVRALVTIDRQSRVGQVVNATDVPSPGLQQYRRSGDYMYAIREGNRTLETGAIAGDPFEMRGYGGRATPHGKASGPSATVVVFIPYASKQFLNSPTRNVTIEVYRLDRVPDRQDLTPTTFDSLYQQGNKLVLVGAVSATDLKKGMQ